MQWGTIVRVFIASPSDVRDERRKVCQLIQEWNHTHSKKGVIVEPILWETHARAAAGADPQTIIDRQLLDTYDCDVLIAIFWSRLGSPTESFDSGTIHEIERFSKTRRGNKDRVMLFFCKWGFPDDSDLKELARLRKFHAEAKEWSLCPEIRDRGDFENVVRRHLDKALNEIISLPTFNKDAQSPPSQPTPTQLCGQAMQRSLDAYMPLWKAAIEVNDDVAASAIIRTLKSLITDVVNQYEPIVPQSSRWQQLIQFHDDLQRFVKEMPANTSEFWHGSIGLFSEFVALSHALQLTY